jgi:acetyl-CoA carboxylase biotin carboxyl carrier protein
LGEVVTLSGAEIREILKLFVDSELQDLRLEIGDVRLAVSRSGAAELAAQAFSPSAPRAAGVAPAAAAETTDIAAAAAPAPAPPKAAAKAPAKAAPVRADWVAVTSPSVGIFYRRPAPDQPPFVEVGSVVAAGDPVCLIEVMKMFTGVVAPHAGRIVEIAVADATMVEHGQPLMYIEPP